MYYTKTKTRAVRDGFQIASTSRLAIIVMALTAVFFAVIILYPQTALAASPLTRSIDIMVELDNYGGGYITEVWDVRTVDGTEFFLTKYYLQDQKITDLSVRDETGRDYRNIGAWNSQRSREEKDGQCGLISINGGYEICWGIGANYGDHIYTVRYYMNNLVKSCNDYDILYQLFVSSDLLAPVQNVELVVKSPGMVFTTENTGVWGFGHSGDIWVTEGMVVSKSQRSLSKSDYVTVLLRFDKGMFSPELQLGKNFEDIRTEALTGSSYTKANTIAAGSSIISSLFTIGFPLLAFFLLIHLKAVYSSRHKLSNRKITKKIYKELPYYREIPFNGSLTATYNRFRESSNTPEKIGNLVGAFILKWIYEDKAYIVSKKGFLTKEQAALHLQKTPYASAAEIEQALYEMFLSAAGTDNVLECSEMRRWSIKNYDEIEKWLKNIPRVAYTELTNMGCAAFVEIEGIFGKKHKRLRLTPYGEEMTDRMYGLIKFLEEFTIINERDPNEVKLWHNYLIYAQVFGIAKQVTSRLEKLCPQLLQDSEFNISAMNISNTFAGYMNSGYESGRTAASSGGGGGFSGGGGGGASGGGSSGGGGTR